MKQSLPSYTGRRKVSDLSIKSLRRIEHFSQLYAKLLCEHLILSRKELENLLKIAIIFINSKDESLSRLGYRIILLYCVKFKSYNPLYEVAINCGLYPISDLLSERYFANQGNVFTELNASFMSLYKEGNVCFTEAQKDVQNFNLANKDNSVAIVAPTSYGKTELILKIISQFEDKKVCVITPTKSLLNQTKKRVQNKHFSWISKVVVNPEMYNGENACVAVLTQERLLRLLKNNEHLAFDCVVIDEAHNLLQNNNRQKLLASVMIFLKKRNSNVVFKFLTPFLNDVSNLMLKFINVEFHEKIVNEYVKSEVIKVADFRSSTKTFKLYDQFLNRFYEMPILQTETVPNFIKNNSVDKNILYFNKPIDIEQFANVNSSLLGTVRQSDKLARAVDQISNYVSPEYNLVDCLKNGVVYHHGSMPENIRQYVEYLYSEISEIKYVVTSSTLLEGVNLPANRIFLMDNRKGGGGLSPSALKNLMGRICRFSEIFSRRDGHVDLLLPEIYFIVGEYYKSNANVESYIKDSLRIDYKNKDEVENVLLEKVPTSEDNPELKKSKEFIENFQSNSIDDYHERKVQTQVGKNLVQNNVNEIDVFAAELCLQRELNEIPPQSIDNVDCLINCVVNVFISRVTDDENVIRLRNDAAQQYYKHFLKWMIEGQNLNRMIASTVGYWKNLVDNHGDVVVYVGRWGDLTKGGVFKYWTDVSAKNGKQLINLAIVRIKEEQDFVENVLMKFFEVLNDMGKLEDSFYLKIKYGTTNQKEIVLIKNGFSTTLAKLLCDEYAEYVSVNETDNSYQIRNGLIDAMERNDVNDIVVFEMKNNLN